MSLILHSQNKQLDVSRPVVMGILNATPDSFYSRGHGSDEDALLQTVEKMLKDGASILDIGGASTRPGQNLLDVHEELQRVMPVIEAITKQFPDVWLSIDTYHSKVAREAVAAGVSIVNDVSSGRFDPDMLRSVAALKVPYIAMHMQGTPKTMQVDPQYTDVVNEVYDYLHGVCDQAADAGIAEVIVDPGFGFGKSVEHNFQLLGSLHRFTALGKPFGWFIEEVDDMQGTKGKSFPGAQRYYRPPYGGATAGSKYLKGTRC